ncbi:unnamed protein product, partial [Didymodactylos carnosus]
EVLSSSNMVNMNKKEFQRLANERIELAKTNGPTVCIDCAYNQSMSGKELASLARQIGRCYSSNRRSLPCVHLVLTNWSNNSPLTKECQRVNSGFDKYNLTLNEKPVHEAYPTERLIYLSPNASNELETINQDDICVIGGLVDESVKKNLTFQTCSEKQIACYRLPIEKYMGHSTTGGSFNQILSINQAARLGEFVFNAVNDVVKIETPTSMLYTRSGVVPHLVNDQLPDNVTKLIELPLSTILESITNLESYPSNGGYAQYSNLPYGFYTPLHDPLLELRSGCNGNLYTSVWTKSGRKEVNIDRFNTYIDLIKPTVYQSMFDGDTFDDSTEKRYRKDRERTLRLFGKIQKKQNMIVSLVGGSNSRYRQLYLEGLFKLVDKQQILGVSFEGFHKYGPQSELFNIDAHRTLIAETKKKLDNDNILYILPLLWRPDNVVRAIDYGIDLFSGAYVPFVTERLGILNFIYNLDEYDNKEQRQTEYNLSLKIYYDLNEPLIDKCPCYTCKNYTKSYIHHLIHTKELLGRTLIMYHNLYHYNEFFKHIRLIFDIVLCYLLTKNWPMALQKNIPLRKGWIIKSENKLVEQEQVEDNTSSSKDTGFCNE